MKIVIISIGNELLRGRTVNTNATEIGQKLTLAGNEVYRGLIVQDNEAEISWAINQAMAVADLIVTTGGLGPTYDDITVQSIAKALGLRLIEDPRALEIIKKKYSALGVELTSERLKMAFIPEGARIIENKVGTAPGLEIKFNGKIILILPGVPNEARSILEVILPELTDPSIFVIDTSKFYSGMMESQVAPLISDIMKKLSGNVYIKTHPRNSESRKPAIEVEIVARGKNREEAEMLSDQIFNEISNFIKGKDKKSK